MSNPARPAADPWATTPASPAKIHGLAELVQAVPYLLGFHPSESVVVLGLRRGTLVVTARVDLEDVAGLETVPVTLLEHTVRSACASDAHEFLALIFTGRPDRPRVSAGSSLPPGVLPLRPASSRGPRRYPVHLPGVGVIAELAAVIDAFDGCLIDAVLVREGHCWPYDSARPRGWPLDPTPSPFVVERTVDGTAPVADRETLAASLQPYPVSGATELEVLLADELARAREAERCGRFARWDRAARRALPAACRASQEPGWSGPPDSELARLAVALTFRSVRDSVWMSIEHRRLDGRPLMAELARRCPPPYCVPALFLFGWASWRSGNSMLAGEAVSRVLEHTPDYDGAHLLDTAVTLALDPGRIPRIREGRGVPWLPR